MIGRQRTENITNDLAGVVYQPSQMASSFTRGQNFVCRCAAYARKLRGKAATSPQSPVPSLQSSEHGFTLVEMIMVIVITGIIGGMVAMFIRAPVQGYVDSARRAEMTDIADTALRRISRDLRTALPNSVRVNVLAGVYYLDFLSTNGGGRYRSGAGGNMLDFAINDPSFDVLGTAPTCVAGNIDQIVVYNLGITNADAYAGDTRTPCNSVAAPQVNITAKKFPFESPAHRFHVVHEQVRYICDPAIGLTRYWWDANSISPPAAIVPAGAGVSSALLADHVGACNFTYNPNVVAQRTGVVTMQLTITENSESVTLYNATHVSNEP